jgi:exosortase family protein XrtM
MSRLFLILFLATYVVLYLAYSAVPQALLSEYVYHYGMVEPSEAMINWALPAEHAVGIGDHLESATVNLRIVRGCDGSGVVFLLVAAIVAMRMNAKKALLGIGGAVLLVYAINQLRIIALYVILSRWPACFTAMHVYFIPTLMILISTIYFAGLTTPHPHEVEPVPPH